MRALIDAAVRNEQPNHKMFRTLLLCFEMNLYYLIGTSYLFIALFSNNLITEKLQKLSGKKMT